MKKTIIHNNQSFEIDIQKQDDQTTIVLDGKEYVFSTSMNHSGWLLTLGKKVYSTYLMQKQTDNYHVNVNGVATTLTYEDPYAMSDALGGSGSQGDITAVMPGRVVKILVAEGQEVKQNEPVLVLEAMKMENEIKAPIDGTVEKVVVAEQDSVDSKTLMMVIAPD